MSQRPPSPTPNRGRGQRLGWLLPAAFLILWPLGARGLAPIQDETYYWTWSRALSWSYVDHPPGVAVVLWASTRLFGDGLLGLRLPSLAAIALTLLALSRGTARLRAGAESVALLLLLAAPMFVVGYLPATPDPYQGAALALGGYALVRAFEPSPRARWLFLAPLLLLAGTLFKHSNAVLALGVCLGAAATDEGRARLRHPAALAGITAGLLAVVPWLAADLSAQGSVAFQLERVHTRGGGRGLLALPVLAGATLVALGPGALLLWSSLWRIRRWGPLERATLIPAFLLLLSCVPAVWRGGGELNWSMPALLLPLPALAAHVHEDSIGRWGARLALPGASLLALVLLHVAWPFLPLPVRKDTTQRGAGFAELAGEVEAQAREEGVGLLITRRYQLASQLRYHLRDRYPVLELGTQRRTQYTAWAAPPLCRGQRALLLSPNPELPADLAAAPVGGLAPRELWRVARGAPQERYYLHSVVALEDRGACGGRG